MTDLERLEAEVLRLTNENQALQEGHDRFNTVFERSRLGNKIIDSNLCILQLNAALVTLLGYDSKEDIIGTKIFDYAPEDRRQDWKFLQENLWAKLMPSFSLETCLLRRDQTLIWCQVTSILIPDNGRTLGYTILEDITERRELRIQREEFISVASHELKTPITSLSATLQVMNRKLTHQADFPKDLIKLSTTAERNVIKLSHLVADLLNTTRIEQGQLGLNKTLFSLEDVIEGCCSHINVETGYAIVNQGDLSLKVFADPFKIDQVLVNLVNNAVKYAPESKEIFINVEHQKGKTKVSVTDKGPGIAKQKLKHLFERYYRADGTQGNGLGLGLYISSEIIRRHGGEMGVESILGDGSTFWFTLPDA
jgi:PAS domain S-box-containing protein